MSTRDDELASLSLGLLATLTAALPAGEDRPGQREMVEAVSRAITTGRHLVVQAGTGTGKSLGYLVPAVLSNRKVVVATATKALQDQLVRKDLPFLAEHLPDPFTYALLKGRSNYICLQRVHEIEQADEQLELDPLAERAPARDLERLVAWADETDTGDRADLELEPQPASWAAVSVSAVECPGAGRCPRAEGCFAERARRAASSADVVVVNTHLYGLHLASGGAILPDHEIVVLDEAHLLEDIVSATSGLEIGPGRFLALSRTARSVLAEPEVPTALEDAGRQLGEVLAPDAGRRIRRMSEPTLLDALESGRRRGEALITALRAVPADAPTETAARAMRAMAAATQLVEDLGAAMQAGGPEVVWVEGPPHRPALRVAPLEVDELLAEALWSQVTAVLCSATIPPRMPERLGLAPETFEALDAGSPFDHEENALLYCAAHLPDPRSERRPEAVHEELLRLIEAAGGRTLALFTSWRAMDSAVEALEGKLPGPLLGQRDLPKPALLEAFSDDEHSSLFATMGFWQGVDVPGPSLSLVTIDRIPFPRPDEPLLEARREHAREKAFSLIDLPRAATLLAQGAGRLIRTATDRGVVAVLDPRLATGSYRWDLVRALPPMRRTADPDEAAAFLRSIADEAGLNSPIPRNPRSGR